MFSSIANHYDLFNTLFSFNRDKHWRKFTVSCAGLMPGELALDIATGTGRLASELSKESKAGVIGVDFCQKMLHKARDRAMNNGNTGFTLADAECLPFPDNTFDCATIGFALRNVADIERTLQEVTRVVKVGRRVVCLEFSHPPNKLFGKFYHFYLHTVLPFLGALLSRNEEAYTYLPQSIKAFPMVEELRQSMERVGLKEIQIHLLTMGVSAVHVGTKTNK